MKLVNKLTLGIAFSAFLASAAPIGILGFGGAAEITLNTIDFAPFVAGAAYNGTGQISASGTRFGIFDTVPFGEVGTIVDRDADGGSVPAQPAGSPILVEDWIQFPSTAAYRIDLTFIKPGSFGVGGCNSDVVGDRCTPVIPGETSPYELVNNSGPQGPFVGANFTVAGEIRDRATEQLLYVFTGRLGAEIGRLPNGEVATIDNLLDYLAADPANNSIIADSFSGQIDVMAIPEPSTFGLAGLALMGLAAAGRRLKK